MALLFGLGMTQGYHMRLLKTFFDNVLLDHGGLTHDLCPTVHLDFFLFITGRGDHSKSLLHFEFFFYLRPLSCLKVVGGVRLVAQI